jgi:hypothetical protein
MFVAGSSALVAAVFAFSPVFWVAAVFVFSVVFPQPANAKIPKEAIASKKNIFFICPPNFLTVGVSNFSRLKTASRGVGEFHPLLFFTTVHGLGVLLLHAAAKTQHTKIEITLFLMIYAPSRILV